MASSTAARRALALEEPLVPSALPDDEATKLAVFRAAILVHGAWTGACVAQRSRGDASAAGKRVARRRASLLAPREARETAQARGGSTGCWAAAFYSATPPASRASAPARRSPPRALLGALLLEAALEAVARAGRLPGAGRPSSPGAAARSRSAPRTRPRPLGPAAAALTPASALCRCLLVLTHDRNVRTQLRLIARVAPDVLSVLALLGCVVLLYAWFATLIFQNETAEGREVFPTYGASVRHGAGKE
ncbi:hypothetical protein JL722_10044 [Aureococcus anophagefferens]|nr:hypothetical protein JL722_10044 [Aureococcus anophagefferens]